jgi:hypothetical protein
MQKSLALNFQSKYVRIDLYIWDIGFGLPTANSEQKVRPSDQYGLKNM